MKYNKGCVANQSPVRTLEEFLVNDERENLVNFAKITDYNLVFYRVLKGNVKAAIKYGSTFEIDGISLAVVKRAKGEKLGQYVLFDPISGALVLDEQKTITRLKTLFKALVDAKGAPFIKARIEAAQAKDTQDSLKDDYIVHN